MKGNKKSFTDNLPGGHGKVAVPSAPLPIHPCQLPALPCGVCSTPSSNLEQGEVSGQPGLPTEPFLAILTLPVYPPRGMETSIAFPMGSSNQWVQQSALEFLISCSQWWEEKSLIVKEQNEEGGKVFREEPGGSTALSQRRHTRHVPSDLSLFLPPATGIHLFRVPKLGSFLQLGHSFMELQ